VAPLPGRDLRARGVGRARDKAREGAGVRAPRQAADRPRPLRCRAPSSRSRGCSASSGRSSRRRSSTSASRSSRSTSSGAPAPASSEPGPTSSPSGPSPTPDSTWPKPSSAGRPVCRIAPIACLYAGKGGCHVVGAGACCMTISAQGIDLARLEQFAKEIQPVPESKGELDQRPPRTPASHSTAPPALSPRTSARTETSSHTCAQATSTQGSGPHRPPHGDIQEASARFDAFIPGQKYVFRENTFIRIAFLAVLKLRIVRTFCISSFVLRRRNDGRVEKITTIPHQAN
jgi:hypothetical protein